jgi:hypothetical protein
MGLGSAILPCPYEEIRDNHTDLVSAILPCPYPEIRDKHVGFLSAILPCPCAEIRDNHLCLGSFILPYTYAGIWDNQFGLIWAHSFFLEHMKDPGIIIWVWASHFIFPICRNQR